MVRSRHDPALRRTPTGCAARARRRSVGLDGVRDGASRVAERRARRQPAPRHAALALRAGADVGRRTRPSAARRGGEARRRSRPCLRADERSWVVGAAPRSEYAAPRQCRAWRSTLEVATASWRAGTPAAPRRRRRRRRPSARRRSGSGARAGAEGRRPGSTGSFLIFDLTVKSPALRGPPQAAVTPEVARQSRGRLPQAANAGGRRRCCERRRRRCCRDAAVAEPPPQCGSQSSARARRSTPSASASSPTRTR